jgi:hypothetical protein
VATFTITQSSVPYYTVLIEFAAQAFQQLLISVKTGALLDAQFQDYADAYENEWVPLVVDEDPANEGETP